MTQNNNILQELLEMESTLANMAPQNTYSVPEGYFEELANLVLSRIRANASQSVAEELGHLSPFLSGLSRKMPFTVPAGYFENMNTAGSYPTDAEPASAQEELARLSPMLSGLKKEVPYAVPQGYFENLHELRSKKDAPVVSIGRKWLRYAAAASIVGLLGLAGILVINKRNEPENRIARIEKSLNKDLKNVNEQELTAFVQQFTDVYSTKDEVITTDQKAEIKELLKDIPDTELKEFLAETSDPGTGDEISIN
ncbi:MAG TPA: hypothetical protein VLJ68_09130 [Chitinophagaceae bacterium]|nr:hypothetical protein [Chitinophagaceae bacterium]